MSFVLSHRVVQARDAPDAPRHAAYVLHGALGSGQNFGRFAQRLAEARPEYAYVLVDLRNHGQSSGAPPPHTLESCARDLHELSRELGRPPRVVIGHSFGGKVALELSRQLAEPETRSGSEGLRQVWVLDAVPGAQREAEGSEVSEVIRAVRGVPVPAESRGDVVEHLMQREGLSSGMAQWMATNLRRDDGRYRWTFDLDGIEELMRDYFRQDLWPYLEREREAPQIELLVAEHSDRWTGEMRERARSLPEATRTRYHALPDSGHWVHVDNPDALLALMREQMV